MAAQNELCHVLGALVFILSRFFCGRRACVLLLGWESLLHRCAPHLTRAPKYFQGAADCFCLSLFHRPASCGRGADVPVCCLVPLPDAPMAAQKLVYCCLERIVRSDWFVWARRVFPPAASGFVCLAWCVASQRSTLNCPAKGYAALMPGDCMDLLCPLSLF